MGVALTRGGGRVGLSLLPRANRSPSLQPGVNVHPRRSVTLVSHEPPGTVKGVRGAPGTDFYLTSETPPSPPGDNLGD